MQGREDDQNALLRARKIADDALIKYTELKAKYEHFRESKAMEVALHFVFSRRRLVFGVLTKSAFLLISQIKELHDKISNLQRQLISVSLEEEERY